MQKNRFFIAALAVIFVAGLAVAQGISNYMEQGGSRWVVGGSLDVVSGGDLDIESGGALKIGGTAITSTAAELNAVDGIATTGLVFGNGETLNVVADDIFDFTRNDAGAVTFTCSDDDATAACVYGTGGASIVTLGTATATSATVVTDGGTVTMDGSITSDANDLAWSIVAGANTACTTTCTSACVVGFDDGAADAENLVDCADATADKCLCAGSS